MAGAKKATIIDAVVEVLRAETRPATAKEIHDRIVEMKLFEFAAKDPVAMVRAAIRKHLRLSKDPGSNPPRLKQTGRDSYTIA